MNLLEELDFISGNIDYETYNSYINKQEQIQDNDKLFIQGDSYFTWQQHLGLDTAFESQILGYKNGADILVDFLLLSGNDIRDTFVYPILFMYRQFFELSLKRLYLCYCHEEQKKKNENIKKAGHNLETMWKYIEDMLKSYRYEGENLNIARKYIEQMHRMDSNSFIFRYPTDIDGSFVKYNSDSGSIDLRNLKDKINRFNNFISSIENYIFQFYQKKH